MSSELITLLEKEAAAERERILAEAQAQAAEIRATAEAEAGRVVEEQRAQQETLLRAAGVRAESTANLRASALVLEAKDQAIAEVFRRAETVLEEVLQDRNHYGQVLDRLLDEGVRDFPGAAVVEAHPEDLALAQAAARHRNLDVEVRSADDVRGGVRLTSRDGRYVLVNALPFRLARARPALVSEVARILWG